MVGRKAWTLRSVNWIFRNCRAPLRHGIIRLLSYLFLFCHVRSFITIYITSFILSGDICVVLWRTLETVGRFDITYLLILVEEED